MSLKTLEAIKKHISDTLGVELVLANDGRDGVAFNAGIDGNIISIFISGPFISLMEKSDDIAEDIKKLDILAFIKENPMRNMSLNLSGVAVDPIDK